MGRAIDTDKKIVDIERRLELVENALEEQIQTRVHHVDLTDMKNVTEESVKEEPRVIKKTTRRKAKTVATT